MEKKAVSLIEFLQGPFTHDGYGMIFDGNGRLIDVPGHRLSDETESTGEQVAKIRGWGIFQYYENGEDLQDEFMDFVVEACNEYLEKKKKELAP